METTPCGFSQQIFISLLHAVVYDDFFWIHSLGITLRISGAALPRPTASDCYKAVYIAWKSLIPNKKVTNMK
ncbi:hypothetical protein [Candidatus Nitrotoga sp. M5]|uniref:hypothetical protein n=1 Tax=Candidatus Nitrotoga sp. M5 TaxID=2890409 RepID=UPI001EF19ECB|nr:hypothetical protein [Candidatus Nitrotoga sp. M5]